MLRMVSETVFGVWALGDSLMVFCHLEMKGECCLGLLSLLFDLSVLIFVELETFHEHRLVLEVLLA